MSKRTSKSASRTKKASSRSGTSAKTVATAESGTKHDDGLSGVYASVAKKIKAMSVEEFRASLLEMGIIDAKGKLTKRYRTR